MSLNLVLSLFDQSLLAVVLFLILLLLIFKRPSPHNSRLPPSPPKLPIIGNLHQLSSLLHRSLHSLSKIHGPLMLLQLGQAPTLVVSSADFAREIMKTQDIIFASRPSLKVARLLLLGCRDLTLTPYGEHWRKMRKICVNHLLGVKMVPSFRRVREEEVAFMLTEISTTCSMLGSVNMSKILNLFTNNILCRAVLGKSFRGKDKNKIFCELTEGNVNLLVKFCFEDCFPSLGWLYAVSGLERRARKQWKRWDVVLDEVIEDHIMRKLEDETKDFVDVLLSLQNDASADFAADRDLIKLLLLVIFRILLVYVPIFVPDRILNNFF